MSLFHEYREKDRIKGFYAKKSTIFPSKLGEKERMKRNQIRNGQNERNILKNIIYSVESTNQKVK